MTSKKNCWEFKKCDREPGGAKARQLGICHAATEKRLNAIHGGKNAGRACWVVAGTFCGEKIRGTYAEKYESCIQCDFYQLVLEEEGSDFMAPSSMLAQLNTYAKSQE